MPPIQLLIKPSSLMCNLACEYCFYHDVASHRGCENYGFMGKDTMEHLVKRVFEYATDSCVFAFQGGEPTLIGLEFFKTVLELQRQYNKSGIAVHNAIQTNGVGLDESWASFFVENRFLVGLSIDGVNVTHDTYRRDIHGEGTFGEVMKTVELFNRYQVEYNVLTVVNGKTAEKIRRIYGFYEKNQFRYLQFIACLDPLFEIPGKREFSLTPQVYGRFLVELFDLWYFDYGKGKQPFIRMFENYIGIFLGYFPESCEQRGTCSLQYVIEADGSVYPCDFFVLDEYRLGNVNEDSFFLMEKSQIGKVFIEESKHPKVCQACEYFSLCMGGCRRHRTVQNEDGEWVNYFCQSYQYFFEKCGPRMREIASEILRKKRRKLSDLWE